MKYPIDAEKYITTMRLEFGQIKFSDEVYLAILSFVNDAYSAGLHGEDGYPLDVNEEMRMFAEKTGRHLERIQGNMLLPPLIQWANRAYDQGWKDAETAATV